MKISVIGTGYVGLVTATCFAFLGHDVCCLDINEERIINLQNGKIPIYEPYLEDLLKICKTKQNYPKFTTQAKQAIEHGDFVFIAVGTPPKASGEADLSYLESAANTIGLYLKESAIVINKSTVPVGSGNWVAMLIENGISKRASGSSQTLTKIDFAVASNPEFLREGCAISDTLYPDRIVIGSDDPKVAQRMQDLYEDLAEQKFTPPDFCPRPANFSKVKIISTDIVSAEMIKYSANAFLASKISFANQIANICDLVGADINQVMQGIGSDSRIGAKFLNAGIGWGGSCFGKDVDALISIAQDYGYEPEILQATKKVNYRQRDLVVKRLQENLKIIKGKKIAILGLAFKPNTDDLRDAPAIDIAQSLSMLGARVVATDPIAIEHCKKLYPNLIVEYFEDPYAMVQGADALVLVTEWQEYLELDMQRIKNSMQKNPIFIDGRNQYEPSSLRDLGFVYIGIGRP